VDTTRVESMNLYNSDLTEEVYFGLVATKVGFSTKSTIAVIGAAVEAGTLDGCRVGAGIGMRVAGVGMRVGAKEGLPEGATVG